MLFVILKLIGPMIERELCLLVMTMLELKLIFPPTDTMYKSLNWFEIRFK